jgi:hypothetical protein
VRDPKAHCQERNWQRAFLISGAYLAPTEKSKNREVRKMSKRGLETVAIHAGQETPDPTTGSRGDFVMLSIQFLDS